MRQMLAARDVITVLAESAAIFAVNSSKITIMVGAVVGAGHPPQYQLRDRVHAWQDPQGSLVPSCHPPAKQ